MGLQLPNEPHHSIQISVPSIRSKSTYRRLAKAVDDMNENFAIQRRELATLRQAMRTLRQRMLATGQNMRSFHAALGGIDISRLDRKSRRLAAIMVAYEARG